ncbi:MAG: LolA family protein [Planctomycetota bacterium]|jgi:outer membrane lipoprotein-sorting protein
MNDDRIEDILEGMGMEEVPADILKIAEETSNEFSKSLREPPKTHILELIMRSRTIKLAAAAVIMIAALVGIYNIGPSNVALAEVLVKVEEAKAYTYKMNMKMTGSIIQGMPARDQDAEITVTISYDFGMKMETETTDPNTGNVVTQKTYLVPDEKLMVMIMPEQKRFTTMKFTDELLERIKKQNNDPREMIKEMLRAKYTELGKSEIDGVKVDGFETTDPAIYGGTTGDIKVTLWVDSKTWLPFLMEMDMAMNEQMRITGTISDFQWDVPVPKSEFVPVIPDDYEAFPKDGMKMPEMTEEAAIEGFKLVSELTGRYPKNANMMDLMQELQTIMVERMKQSEPQKMTETERVTMMMDTMRPVQSIALFYMTLVEDEKEPVYYGETVGPDDVEAVLIRWKISDDQYRVIFGDLSAMDISAEQLAELEK